MGLNTQTCGHERIHRIKDALYDEENRCVYVRRWTKCDWCQQVLEYTEEEK